VVGRPVRIEVETHSPEATEGLGGRLGARLRPGDVVAVIGPLGAGKTALARGIARGAGATGYVASPSFVIIREYSGPVRVFHADLYRLDRPQDIADLGLDELVEDGGILIVEWADRAEGLLPRDRLDVAIAFGAAEADRILTLMAPPAWADRLSGVGDA
jgi:tRNA threonylcarbamoyladenosine biosynthesis protein TsaE